MYIKALFSPSEISDTALQSKGKPLETFSQASSLPVITCLMAGTVMQPNMPSLRSDGLAI